MIEGPPAGAKKCEQSYIETETEESACSYNK